MSKKNIIVQSRDGYQLSCALYECEKPKAVIQMVHGMEEHKERYDAFASYLASHGFNVLVSDLRGHGENAPLLSHIADKKGDELLIEDQQEIRKYIKDTYKGLPVYLFGHSMGTIISRVLIQTDANEYEKVCLSGYVNPNPAGAAGIFLSGLIALFKGKKGYSRFITNLVMGPFNKNIENPKTPIDWLSYNEENVKAYAEDPLSGKEFTLGSYNALFRLINKMGKAGKYQPINEKLRFLLAAGKDDPCTGFEKGREASKKLLEKAGYKDIEVITYDHMRHEILNETEKQKVYEDLLAYFEK